MSERILNIIGPLLAVIGLGLLIALSDPSLSRLSDAYRLPVRNGLPYTCDGFLGLHCEVLRPV